MYFFIFWEYFQKGKVYLNDSDVEIYLYGIEIFMLQGQNFESKFNLRLNIEV